MQQLQGEYIGGENWQRNTGDWSAEINGGGRWMGNPTAPRRRNPAEASPREAAVGEPRKMSVSPTMPDGGTELDMQFHFSDAEEAMSPNTATRVQLSSLRAMLMQNCGSYVVATFLVGTQSTVTWEGILYAVGSDFMTIYQAGRQRYVLCDMYALKFLEFYMPGTQNPPRDLQQA